MPCGFAQRCSAHGQGAGSGAHTAVVRNSIGWPPHPLSAAYPLYQSSNMIWEALWQLLCAAITARHPRGQYARQASPSRYCRHPVLYFTSSKSLHAQHAAHGRLERLFDPNLTGCITRKAHAHRHIREALSLSAAPEHDKAGAEQVFFVVLQRLLPQDSILRVKGVLGGGATELTQPASPHVKCSVLDKRHRRRRRRTPSAAHTRQQCRAPMPPSPLKSQRGRWWRPTFQSSSSSPMLLQRPALSTAPPASRTTMSAAAVSHCRERGGGGCSQAHPEHWSPAQQVNGAVCIAAAPASAPRAPPLWAPALDTRARCHPPPGVRRGARGAGASAAAGRPDAARAPGAPSQRGPLRIAA